MNNGTAIIIQARMSSSRFPGKMMAELGGKPLVEYIYRRCKESLVEMAIVATSDYKSDDVLYSYCSDNGIPVMRGSLDNVLERFIKVADAIGARYIIRVCGDTPFVDILLAELLLETLIRERLDYISPDRTTCASGFYSEAVTLEALKKTATLTKAQEDLEHVTRYIINNRECFLTRFINVDLNPDFMNNVRLTIDYPKDIKRADIILSQLPGKTLFTSQDILKIVEKIVEKKGAICLE